MTSIVYSCSHKPTGKIYIGSLKNSTRWENYLTSSKVVSPMMKTFPDEWCKKIIHEYDDFQTAVSEEQELIEFLVEEGGWDKVWNGQYRLGMRNLYSPESIKKKNSAQRTSEYRARNSFRQRGKILSDGHRAAIRERLWGNKHSLGHVPSNEVRVKQSAFMMGNKHALGYIHTESAKILMGIKRKGVPKSPAHCLAISKGHKGMLGKTHSEETRIAMSAAQSGDKHNMWGKHHSVKTRAKQSAAKKGKPWSAARRAAQMQKRGEK